MLIWETDWLWMSRWGIKWEGKPRRDVKYFFPETLTFFTVQVFRVKAVFTYLKLLNLGPKLRSSEKSLPIARSYYVAPVGGPSVCRAGGAPGGDHGGHFYHAHAAIDGLFHELCRK